MAVVLFLANRPRRRGFVSSSPSIFRLQPKSPRVHTVCCTVACIAIVHIAHPASQPTSQPANQQPTTHDLQPPARPSRRAKQRRALWWCTSTLPAGGFDWVRMHACKSPINLESTSLHPIKERAVHRGTTVHPSCKVVLVAPLQVLLRSSISHQFAEHQGKD
jgi:hypothetical protein